jgi:hypothetical protein
MTEASRLSISHGDSDSLDVSDGFEASSKRVFTTGEGKIANKNGVSFFLCTISTYRGDMGVVLLYSE